MNNDADNKEIIEEAIQLLVDRYGQYNDARHEKLVRLKAAAARIHNLKYLDQLVGLAESFAKQEQDKRDGRQRKLEQRIQAKATGSNTRSVSANLPG